MSMIVDSSRSGDTTSIARVRAGHPRGTRERRPQVDGFFSPPAHPGPPRYAASTFLSSFVLQEFTRGMRAMLFEAHNALIASNAWLLTRLQAVEVRTD